ncbi:MAG: hypothetical protein R3F18_18115 [Lysobacterales bacterium]
MAYAATWVGHIASAPRIHMLMQMRHGLARRGADVHTEVEPVNATALANDRANGVDGRKQ